MNAPLSRMDMAEVLARVRQFKRMSADERTFHLEFVAPSRCGDLVANQLFDNVVKGEASPEEEDRFFEHSQECAACYSAFLRLIWLSTEAGGH